MKIVYLIHGLYNAGGMERVLSCKANYLVEKLGYDVHIITRSQLGRGNFFHLSDKIVLHDLGLNYSGVTGRSPLSILKNFKYLFKHYKLLRQKIQDLRPDIMISMYGNELSFLPFIKKSSKIILEYHFSLYAKTIGKNKDINPLYQKIRFAIIKFFIRKYDKFVLLTERDRSNWGFLANSISIPNPMTLSKITSQSECKQKTVISVGRLEFQKGYDLLIDSWKFVNSKYSDWKLIIYGDGSCRSELQRQIIELNLTDSIILHSVIPNLENEYSNASIFVSSSRYEGFPLVIAEAMACGLPVVSFNYPCGPSDIITNYEDGILVEDGNIERLADALISLISDEYERKRMGKNAVIKSNAFELSEIMNKWHTLFQTL